MEKTNGGAGSTKLKYMNHPAKGNQAYIPTEVEHIANVITHGLFVVPSLAGMVFLLHLSHTKLQFATTLVYGMALVALFSVSTVFHSVFYLGKFRILKKCLHLCDRAIIYIFIAASYTPWLVLKPSPETAWGHNVCWVVWIMAILGITYQYFFHERYKHLETCFYMIIGVMPGVAIFCMEGYYSCASMVLPFLQHEYSGLKELALSGIVYMIGVVFFKMDGRIPCAHAIWHLFVNIGATTHYYAVCKFILALNHNLS